MIFTEQAPAKINLTLSVLGKRADGYHTLSSLVVFADYGDTLTLIPDKNLSLTITGPERFHLSEDGNLVLKAAHVFRDVFPSAQTGRFSLVKNLPVASGMGGGSSDAAAALRLMAKHNKVDLDHPTLFQIAKSLGADVPVCLRGKACMMEGIGDKLGPPLTLPPLHALLVNPRIGVSTKDVFEHLQINQHIVHQDFQTNMSFENLIKALYYHTNDLEQPAIKISPIIQLVLSQMAAQPQNRLSRMSGSGATVFGLFPTLQHAENAYQNIRQDNPDWWVKIASLS